MSFLTTRAMQISTATSDPRKHGIRAAHQRCTTPGATPTTSAIASPLRRLAKSLVPAFWHDSPPVPPDVTPAMTHWPPC